MEPRTFRPRRGAESGGERHLFGARAAPDVNGANARRRGGTSTSGGINLSFLTEMISLQNTFRMDVSVYTNSVSRNMMITQCNCHPNSTRIRVRLGVKIPGREALRRGSEDVDTIRGSELVQDIHNVVSGSSCWRRARRTGDPCVKSFGFNYWHRKY